MAPFRPLVALVWLACFVVANAIGFQLWQRRDRLRPYLAIQLLLATCGLAGLLAMLTLHIAGPDAIRQLSWRRSGYPVLLLVPALMAWFAVFEHGARRRSRKAGQD
jgi:hypothetical protein